MRVGMAGSARPPGSEQRGGAAQQLVAQGVGEPASEAVVVPPAVPDEQQVELLVDQGVDGVGGGPDVEARSQVTGLGEQGDERLLIATPGGPVGA